ncbi:MAG: permease [Deltaproteobacteria bacterium]|nr:permease [Deltaproteobacteria bacterium]MBW2533985.1 permease [Deltaproteobacteria bacterium]
MGAIYESLALVRWYAREHVLLCLVPALFIAGAIGVFLSQGAVMKYLGHGARKAVAYPVAAVSGSILAVCSCTVLPLFASIHKRGAGLGPATAFLYSGPAVNVLAIILTARVLGFELGIARAVGAVVFAVVIGLLMHATFRKQEAARADAGGLAMPEEDSSRGLGQQVVYFGLMVGLLVFANWGQPAAGDASLWRAIFDAKWIISGVLAVLLAVVLGAWFRRDELWEWTESSWGFAKQILPLLLAGVAVAGLLLGGPEGGQGLIPRPWVESVVGGNSLGANLFASVAGAFMYFATLTEVPILEGLLAAGMGKGPALALLLAGPALSLPNMLVIRSVLGTVQTAAYVAFVVVLSTVAGLIYGGLF